MRPATVAPASAPAAPESAPLRELRGVVERITYANPENGYAVVRLAPERAGAEAEAARGEDRLVTVVGPLAEVPVGGPGGGARRGGGAPPRGWWRNTAKFGWQFQATESRTSPPATVQGMKKYLGSGLVKVWHAQTRSSGPS